MDAALVCLRGERTDPSGSVEDSPALEFLRIEEEIAAILIECASEQNNSIEV
jgi:hypothetical protein